MPKSTASSEPPSWMLTVVCYLPGEKWIWRQWVAPGTDAVTAFLDRRDEYFRAAADKPVKDMADEGAYLRAFASAVLVQAWPLSERQAQQLEGRLNGAGPWAKPGG